MRATAAAPGRAARNPAITARSTTARTGHPRAAPTPIACSLPADPTTNSSQTATTRPASPTTADWPGPTAPQHPRSTTPTTPKNSYTTTPTHLSSGVSDLGAQQLSARLLLAGRR